MSTIEFYQNMPEELFKNLVEYYSQLKKNWNYGIISLRGSEIKKITEIQRYTESLHPELSYKFNVKHITV